MIYFKKWTNLSQPLVFENRNVDISEKIDQLKSASGVWKYKCWFIEMDQYKSASGVWKRNVDLYIMSQCVTLSDFLGLWLVRAVAASWSLIGWETSIGWARYILYSLCTLVQTQADHETSVQSVSVHVYTQIPPRCPRAMGGEETLLSVAGLGAYVGTKSGTTRPREWKYFWHEHRRCSRGHSTIRNSAAI